MPLHPITFESHKDLGRAISKSISFGNNSAKGRQFCFVANDGNTYFFDDIKQLTDDEAQQSTLTFATKTGERVSLAHVKHAVENNNHEFLRNLIHNAPLIELLDRISVWNLAKTSTHISKLNPAFPIINPVITPYEDSYEESDIKKWLLFLKTSGKAPYSPSNKNKLLSKSQLIPNHALRNLIWFVLREGDKAKQQLVKEACSENDLTQETAAVVRLQQRKWLAVENRLLDEKLNLVDRIEKLETIKNVNQPILSGNSQHHFSKNIENKSKKELRTIKDDLEVKRIAAKNKAKTVSTISQKTAAIATLVTLLGLFPLLGFGMPIAIGTVIVATIVVATALGVGYAWEAKLNHDAKKFAERQDIVANQIQINSLPKLQKKLHETNAKLDEIKSYKQQKRVLFKANIEQTKKIPDRKNAMHTMLFKHDKLIKPSIGMATSESLHELQLRKKIKL